MEINKDRLCKELKKLRDYYKGNPKKDFIKSDYPKFVILNNIFMSCGTYDKKHNYLMTNDEYLNSSTRTKRIKLYDKTNLINKKDDV